jgi:hypothetical protein
MAVRLKDIARDPGVSVVTVIGDETRRRLLPLELWIFFRESENQRAVAPKPATLQIRVGKP